MHPARALRHGTPASRNRRGWKGTVPRTQVPSFLLLLVFPHEGFALGKLQDGRVQAPETRFLALGAVDPRHVFVLLRIGKAVEGRARLGTLREPRGEVLRHRDLAIRIALRTFGAGDSIVGKLLRVLRK